MKILFIENDGTFADTVTRQFLEDHDVTIVGNVMEALDIFRQRSFDAILVDYDLDDFKGDTFVRRVRALGSTVPMIAVSARDTGNAALLQAGADAVCHKAHFRQIGEVIAQRRVSSV